MSVFFRNGAPIFGFVFLVVFGFQNCGQFTAKESESFSSLGSSAEDRGDSSLAYNAQTGQIEVTGSQPVASDCDIRFEQDKVYTHYKTGVGFTYGAVDSAVVLRTESAAVIDSELAKSGGEPVRYYTSDYSANPNFYFDEKFDRVSLSISQMKSVLQSLCTGSAKKVLFRQPPSVVANATDLQSLAFENQDSYQVISGLVFKNNMFTIILPPHWNRQAKYSTLMTGHYSINEFLSARGVSIFSGLSALYEADKKGSIAILWNVGGTIVNRSSNARNFRELNDFLKLAVPTFSMDAAKVVTLGGSRGGATALNIASSPHIDQVRVAYVYANVPPADLNILSDLATPTFPGLLWLMDESTGYYGSWLNTFRMPNGMTGKQFQRYSLTGSSDETNVAQEANLGAPSKVNKLVQNKTNVFLDLGTHDPVLPFLGQLKLLEIYQKSGVRVEALIRYLGGHGTDEKIFLRPMEALRKLNTNANPLELTLVNNGMRTRVLRNFDTSPGGLGSLAPGVLPLTIEFPRFYGSDADIHVVMTGKPSDRYYLRFVGNNGALLGKTVSLDNDGTALIKLNPTGIDEITFLGAFPIKSDDHAIQRANFLISPLHQGPIKLVRDEKLVSKISARKFSETLAQFQKSTGMSGTTYGFVSLGLNAATEEEVQHYRSIQTAKPAKIAPVVSCPKTVYACNENILCTAKGSDGDLVGCNETGECKKLLSDRYWSSSKVGEYVYSWQNSPQNNTNLSDINKTFYVKDTNGLSSAKISFTIKACPAPPPVKSKVSCNKSVFACNDTLQCTAEGSDTELVGYNEKGECTGLLDDPLWTYVGKGSYRYQFFKSAQNNPYQQNLNKTF
ncbi:MAG: hypothetical protein HUU57_09500 [Bdellovibrio sp.]|nr:hypothetical protein [Bdellovibrio sp.]